MSKLDFIKSAEKELRETKKEFNKERKELQTRKREVRAINKKLSPAYRKKLRAIKRNIYKNNYIKISPKKHTPTTTKHNQSR